MYQDQRHGSVKVVGQEEGVNITVELPVLRTSVDHGTAFDIAGPRRADERSVLEAMRQALAEAPKRASAHHAARAGATACNASAAALLPPARLDRRGPSLTWTWRCEP
jgi:hypothetical protein